MIRAAVLLFLPLFVTAGVAQTPTVTQAPVSPPSELAPAIAGVLGSDVTTVTTGSARLEFWLVKALELAHAPSPDALSWTDVPEGALVGVLRLGSTWTDIRGFTIRPGVYTLRFALQPQNGDHMGISPHREFLLPGPAAEDTAVAPVGYDGALELAKKVSRRAHPASISLDPPVSPAAPGTVTTSDLGHQVVILRVPVTFEGTPAGHLAFGVVVQGTIDN